MNFSDCAIIIRRGSWIISGHKVILRSAPYQQRLWPPFWSLKNYDQPPPLLLLGPTHWLTLTWIHSLCPLPLFNGWVYNITSKLRLTKPAISIQTDCASSFVSSYDSLDWRFESFASLPSISDWVMTSTKITHSYYSLFSSTDSLKVLLQAQQELKQRHSDSLCETRSHSWWDTRAPTSDTSNFRFLLLLGRQLAHKNIRYQSPLLERES